MKVIDLIDELMKNPEAMVRNIRVNRYRGYHDDVAICPTAGMITAREASDIVFERLPDLWEDELEAHGNRAVWLSHSWNDADDISLQGFDLKGEWIYFCKENQELKVFEPATDSDPVHVPVMLVYASPGPTY